jgi:PadR family transcriptional regulator, regulatory protein PadR
MRDPIAREFLLAFWKIHILHHAADGRGVYGQWMLEELHHHGYRLSPGTLYPILARMAKRGWLRAAEPKRTKAPRVYRLTPRGHQVLAQLRHALDELYGEVGAHADRHQVRAAVSPQRRGKRSHPASRSASD